MEGYWLDDERFFFLAERFESAFGRILSVPSIADMQEQQVKEIVSLEVLGALLSASAGNIVDTKALSCAEFDMRDRDTLGVSVGGAEYLVDVRGPRVIAARKALEAPALYSPDGRYACLIKGHDLWLREVGTGEERALTRDGVPHNSYGQQPESGLSALSYRKHPVPMGRWSEDSQWLLTHRIDERAVPEVALIEHAPCNGGRPVLHRYKYPIPGDSLPVTTYIAIHVASGRIVEFDEFPDSMLAFSPFTWRTVWFCGNDTAWFVRVDRFYKQVELVVLDLVRGTGRVVIRESVSSGYVELHQVLGVTPNIRTLRDSGEVVWFSERDGWGHLYLYDGDTGVLKNRITQGEWLVRDIVHVDERQRKVLFTACGIDRQVDPARRSLCSVNLDGSGFEVLLAHEGDVAVPKTEPSGSGQDRRFRPSHAQPGLSPDGRFYVARLANVERGNRTEIVDLQTARRLTIASAQAVGDRMQSCHFTAVAADGVTPLYGVLFFPSDFDRNLRYPLVDYIYPGPQIPWQPQSYLSVHSAQARAMAELGFVTVMMDTRNMPFRQRADHQVGYGELLEPQLADHAAVVRQLCERHPYIDADRIGIFGYSGGGAASARAVFDYGAIFKVCVSVCGNHDSALNTAAWSDKYRGPSNPESWPAQANHAAAHKLRGKLLLISGDLDENVHVSQTLSLADALIRANRDFDLLIVPNEGHLVLLTNGYAQRRTWDYFVRHLLGATPPEDFEIKFEPHELARMMTSWMRELQ